MDWILNTLGAFKCLKAECHARRNGKLYGLVKLLLKQFNACEKERLNKMGKLDELLSLFVPTLTFGGVQVSKSEFESLSAIYDSGTCPLCNRTGLTNRYGSKKKHWRTCSNKFTLLEKEKLFVQTISEAGEVL